MEEQFVGYLVVSLVLVFVFIERVEQFTVNKKPIELKDLFILMASFAGVFIMGLLIYKIR